MASRSIICRSRRLRQIIDLRDTEKSRYFAITEFNNCFIIPSASLFSYFSHLPAAQGSDLPFSVKKVVPIMHEKNIICSKTCLDGTTHEHTIIRRQLFAGHMVNSRPMERKKKMHRMIIILIYRTYWWLNHKCMSHLHVHVHETALHLKTITRYDIIFSNYSRLTCIYT